MILKPALSPARCGLLLALFAVSVAMLVYCHDETSVTEPPSSEIAEHHEPKLFKLLDFNRFKKLFKKSYNSILEELSRKRIYLAKCFRAFISVIDFKRRKSTSYKSINMMSDWTRDEVRKSLNGRIGMPKSSAPPKENDDEEEVDQEQPEEVAQAAQVEAGGIESETDVKRKMIEIATGGDDKQSDDSLDELRKSSDEAHTRSKRDATDTDTIDLADSLSVAELMGERLFEADEDLPEEDQILPITSPESGTRYKKTNMRQKGPLSGGGNLPPKDKNKIRKHSKTSRHIEYDVDHRDCFNPVTSQDQCGSCYIFSALALLEWHYCNLNKGKKAKFSVQFLLDCDTEGSCSGGFSSDVFQFAEHIGLERADSWPYAGFRGRCPYQRPIEEPKEKTHAAYWKVSNLDWQENHYDDLESEIKKWPLTITMATEDAFSEYGGGIDEHANCEPGEDMHSMVLVGRGREDGREFWLMRNSYSDSWGEQGYYRISLEGLKRCMWTGEESAWALVNTKLKFSKNRAYEYELVKSYITRRMERIEKKKASE